MRFTVWVRNQPIDGLPQPITKLLLTSMKATWPAQDRELQEKVVKAGWAVEDIVHIFPFNPDLDSL